MTAPAIPAGYEAVLDARSEVVDAMEEVSVATGRLRRAQLRVEAAVAAAARAENGFAGYDLPAPHPTGSVASSLEEES